MNEDVTKQSRKPLNLPLLIVIPLTVFIIFAVTLYVWMEKQVTINDDGKLITVKTMQPTVAGVLEENNITLNPEDVVKPGLEEKVKEEMEILIKRAFPVAIKVDGKNLTLKTTDTTVMSVLEKAGIKLNPKDRVQPSLDSKVYRGMEIKVTRVTVKYITEKERIYYHLIRRKNDELDKGVTRIVQQGHEGVKEVTYKVIYEDGVEVKREIVQEKVLKEKQDKIVEYGTRDSFINSRGERVRFTKALTMIATAYDSSYSSTGKRPGDPGYGITYTGIPARRGVVAVDPRVIPLGTRLYVEGYGYALAADTGSAIKGNRIDLYYETYEEAMRYGRKKVKVYILADQN